MWPYRRYGRKRHLNFNTPEVESQADGSLTRIDIGVSGHQTANAHGLLHTVSMYVIAMDLFRQVT